MKEDKSAPFQGTLSVIMFSHYLLTPDFLLAKLDGWT